MAYNNKISITAALKDEVSPGLAVMVEKAKTAQAEIAASAKASAASQKESYELTAAAARTSQAEIAAGNKELAASTAAANKAASGGVSNSVALGAAATAGVVAVAAGVMVRAAADFQTSTTKLVTSAGESAGNLKNVGDGILQIARETGTSTKSLADAMYLIESGGQHGAAGLTVLKAAAQGAKAENSDLVTVADAVTSVLQDYHLKADSATSVTSKLVAAVGAGKTNFQDFAGSLHSILPIASSAHISLDDISGALAAMTVHGMSADQASQNLADTVKHMVAPTQVQTKELGQLGISSGDLADKLSKKGLTGTLQELSDVILQHMGPSGRVLLSAFNQSKDAANDANVMISKMPKSLQTLAKEYQNGKISAGDWRTALKDLPTDQANLARQFATLQDHAHGFNDLLKSGSPQAQTYQDALRRVTGDATGLNVALMLTGENTDYVNNAVKTVSKTTGEAGGNVKGWAEVQKTYNQRFSEFKQTIATTGIAIGEALLPALASMFKGVSDALTPVANFISHHRDLTAVVLLGVGALAGFVALTWATQKATDAVSNSFSLATGLAKKFAESIGLINTAQSEGGVSSIASAAGKITGKGGATKLVAGGAVSAAEGVAVTGGTEALGATAAATGGTIAAGIGAALTGPIGIAIGVAIGGAFAAKAIKDHQDNTKKQANEAVGLPKDSKLPEQAKSNSVAAQQYNDKAKTATANMTDTYLKQGEANAKNQQELKRATKAHDDAVNQLNKDYSKYGATSSQVQKDMQKVNTTYTIMHGAQLNASDSSKTLDATSRKLNLTTGQYIQSTKDVVQTTATVTNLKRELTRAEGQENAAKDKVNTAWRVYNDSVARYGKDSPVTQQAMQNLTAAEDDYNKKKSTATGLQDSLNRLENDGKDKKITLKQKTDDLKQAQDRLNGAMANEPKGSAISQLLGHIGTDVSHWTTDVKKFFGFATGTDYAPGGMANVAENGPELLVGPQSRYIAPGSKVIPAGQTSRMLGGGGASVTIGQFIVNNNMDEERIIKRLGLEVAMR